MTSEDKSVEEMPVNEPVSPEDVTVEDVMASESEASSDLVVQLAAAREEASKMRDQYLRSEAEMANLRRRVEKDVENAHKYGQEKLSRELLAVADNLERAVLSSESESADLVSLKEGVDLTLKGLKDLFIKFNIEAIDPEGNPFDPQLHQAMTMVENPNVEPNTVIAVMQKGYLLNGRLIRPAMVMVSKGGTAASKTIDETA
ncbi:MULTISPECIES: nucleotide exchange factor GrpE [Reinekea]|uniref:Protein GrpE n=1 Tax=Reinekea forsetii TaxID=1336806 RepID=A0A2K8L0I0_9GAMM|nr:MULTISPECIES: nucleotide exchange factor GrpE [Reinekea]ATX78016.1 heat shock protein GrpE [Reinekea forsetii]